MFVYWRLVELILQNTAVSDGGLRKLTMPARMFGKGPIGLTQLDISRTIFVRFLSEFLCCKICASSVHFTDVLMLRASVTFEMMWVDITMFRNTPSCPFLSQCLHYLALSMFVVNPAEQKSWLCLSLVKSVIFLPVSSTLSLSPVQLSQHTVCEKMQMLFRCVLMAYAYLAFYKHLGLPTFSFDVFTLEISRIGSNLIFQCVAGQM